MVANVTFGEDISCGTAWKRCHGDTSAVTCCWAALMRGLVLYICVSAVCTLGILQNNGQFLTRQMFYSQNNVLNVPLFNTNRQNLQSTLYSQSDPNHCGNRKYIVWLFWFPRRWHCVDVRIFHSADWTSHVLCAEIRLWSKRILKSVLCVCL